MFWVGHATDLGGEHLNYGALQIKCWLLVQLRPREYRPDLIT